MNLLRSALMGIGVANVSTRCLAQTCQEIVSGGSTDRKLKFLKEEAGRGGARDEGTDIRGIVGGTEVRHRQQNRSLSVVSHSFLNISCSLRNITSQEFLKEEAGMDIHDIVGGTEVSHLPQQYQSYTETYDVTDAHRSLNTFRFSNVCVGGSRPLFLHGKIEQRQIIEWKSLLSFLRWIPSCTGHCSYGSCKFSFSFSLCNKEFMTS